MMRQLVASTSKEVLESTSRRAAKGHQVLISALPSTASLLDIRLLAFKSGISNHAKDPQPNPQVKASKTPPSTLSSSMYDIKILRSKLLNPTGKAIVSFHSAERAKEFAAIANRRSMGGHKIRAKLTSEDIGDASPVVELLSHLQKQSPGRVVLLRGLPARMNTPLLTRVLSRRYQLAQDAVPWVNAAGHSTEYGPVVKLVELAIAHHHFTSSFFVRLASVTDATSLVRKWHQTAYDLRFGQTRERFSSDEELRSENEDVEEDLEGEAKAAEEIQKPFEFQDKWQYQSRKLWNREDAVQKQGIERSDNRLMVDAILMS